VPQKKPPYRIGALILAAGFSSRFGADKRKAVLPNGKTVLQQTVENVSSGIDDVLLVVRNADEQLPDGVNSIIARHAALGMGHSIADAVSAISAANAWDGCLICLADMPLIRSETYRKIANSLTPETIVVPYFEGQRGQPAGFGSSFFSELSALTGDQGGRQILAQNGSVIRRLELSDQGIVLDIDRPEDLATI
jgi:molybdenum cofactor cytidylyltransferase